MDVWPLCCQVSALDSAARLVTVPGPFTRHLATSCSSLQLGGAAEVGGMGGGGGVEEADLAHEGQVLDSQRQLHTVLHSAIWKGGGAGAGGGLIKCGKNSR